MVKSVVVDASSASWRILPVAGAQIRVVGINLRQLHIVCIRYVQEILDWLPDLKWIPQLRFLLVSSA